MAWVESDEENQRLVQAVRVDANGMQGPTQTLAEVPPKSSGCVCPRVVVDAIGRATIAWRGYDGEHARVEAAQIDAAGTFGPVLTLSPPGEDGFEPELAVDDEGRVTVVWRLQAQGNVEAVRLDVEGEPEETQVLAEAVPGLGSPVVAVDPSGEATVVWPSSEGLRSVQIDPAGVVGSIEPIASTDGADSLLEAVADSQGTVTIAWWRSSEAKSVQLSPGGVVGPLQTLTLAGEQAHGRPSVAVDSQDRVTAAWWASGEGVRSVRLAGNGVPGPVQTLSDPGLLAGNPDVAAGASGTTVVAWSHPPVPYAPEDPCTEDSFDPASDVVKVAVLGSEGEALQVENASSYGEQAQRPQIGVASLGLPTVVWESFDGTYFCDGPLPRRIQMSRGMEVEPPAPPAPPPPADPPADPARPSTTSVADAKLHLKPGALARDDHLLLGVRCVSTGVACEGQVRLVVRIADIPGALRKSIRSLRKRTAEVTLARGHFRFAAGVRGTLTLSLSGLGRVLTQRGSGRRLRAVGRGVGVHDDVTYIRLRGGPR
ncbi:MAG TPA: hypothetical protein VFJ76_04555 [Solirubrobacterales bacterium]|nr:hypothetical protein [Solirubrobacterales bacterium]